LPFASHIWSLNPPALVKTIGYSVTTKAHGVSARQPYFERWVCAACFTHDRCVRASRHSDSDRVSAV
jgi:hypothetical protein